MSTNYRKEFEDLTFKRQVRFPAMGPRAGLLAVKAHHDYRPEFTLNVYPDDWKWKEGENRRWREHDGEERGYWNGGVWLKF